MNKDCASWAFGNAPSECIRPRRRGRSARYEVPITERSHPSTIRATRQCPASGSRRRALTERQREDPGPGFGQPADRDEFRRTWEQRRDTRSGRVFLRSPGVVLLTRLGSYIALSPLSARKKCRPYGF